MMHDPSPDHVEPAPAGSHPEARNAGPPPSSPPPKADVPVGAQEEPDHHNRQTQVREWWRIVAETLTLVAVVWYASTASSELAQMRKATEANQRAAAAAKSAADTARASLAQSVEAFRIDERAWIEIGRIDTAIYPPDPPFGITFKYSIFLKNYGKTVATDVRLHIDNIDADTSFGDNRRAIRMSQDELFKISGTNKRATEPNQPGPQIIAPEELTTIPIFSGGQEPKRWGKNFRYTFVLGRIDYRDAFGVNHWMRFCYLVMNSRGELGHCTYGNEEDGNPENPN